MANELNDAVQAIESKLAESVEKYEGQVRESGEAVKSIREEVKSLAAEHASLMQDMPGMAERVKEVEQMLASGTRGGDSEPEKSWGDSVIAAESFAEFKQGSGKKARVEVKNTVLGETTSEPNGILSGANRLPGIVPGAFRALNLLDFVQTGTTGSNQIEYTREASFTDGAAETAEGAVKPESDVTFELVNDPVRTIAHWLKASKQVMDDAPMLASYIDQRLAHGVRRRLQSQILNGNGTAPNLAGLSATGRSTAFTPTASELALDALNRAKYLVIAADYQPNFILLNPADWGALERVKVTGGEYIASGGAALSYINGGMTPLVWGLPVVASNDVTAGNFFLGDSSAMQLFMRQGVAVEMFEQDEDNAQRNLLTIRAEMRAALAVFTPAAIQTGALLA